MEEALKPSEAPELDEDEGFSDWSQKPEPQRTKVGRAPEPAAFSSFPESQHQPHDSPREEATRRCQEHEYTLPFLCHPPSLALSTSLRNEPADGSTGGWEPLGQWGGGLWLETHISACLPQLIDRTESLNRSIRKSNSVKKSQPALPISKIDERLEQYTQAIETAGRTPKLTRQPSIELPSMAVASTKSRWETGEVQAQSTAKTPSCKDIVAGDMSKKSLWEQKGGSKTSSTIKSTPSGKRYKFVATGHGKYEKVLVDEGSVP
ncbi:lymphocyte-specific protein 1-like [Lynx pardinus]|uniref:Lymphocyte-specific protein 1-like n=1 Tax=Lynx pardinus TaxID=191816 RepID=A0A485P2Z7_LYNPA|nr:lymphocyte-specific protein 1-like [Lynx pardinus]